MWLIRKLGLGPREIGFAFHGVNIPQGRQRHKDTNRRFFMRHIKGKTNPFLCRYVAERNYSI